MSFHLTELTKHDSQERVRIKHLLCAHAGSSLTRETSWMPAGSVLTRAACFNAFLSLAVNLCDFADSTAACERTRPLRSVLEPASPPSCLTEMSGLISGFGFRYSCNDWSTFGWLRSGFMSGLTSMVGFRSSDSSGGGTIPLALSSSAARVSKTVWSQEMMLTKRTV